MESIEDWLARHKLSRWLETFQKQNLDVAILRDLTRDDLISIGIPLGDSLRILAAIKQDAALRGPVDERRQLTVVLSDLVASTERVERLGGEAYYHLLLSYNRAVEGVMQRYGGTITRYEGDGVQVLFGYPVAYEDGPERAVRASIESVTRVASILEQPQKPMHSRALSSRVGVATGEVVIGDILSARSLQQFQVFGQAPHLAARLQGIAEPNSVVISELTHEITADHIEAEALDKRCLKGIEKPIQPYRIVKIKPVSVHRQALLELPLISRNAEFRELKRILADIISGSSSGHAVLIVGEAGIGKSRLISELIKSSSRSSVLRLQCLNREKHSMLQPVINSVRELLSRRPIESVLERKLRNRQSLDAQSREEIKQTIELLMSSTSIDMVQGEAQIERKNLFNILFRYLEVVISDRIKLIVLEDVHWADPTTLEFLSLVIDRLAELKILLVITSRAGEIPSCLQDGAIQRMNLAPLTREESIDFVSKLVPAGTLSLQQYEKIADHCDGVPVYLRELSLYIAKEGNDSIIDKIGLAVPETLRDLLIARVDQLGTSSTIIQSASVFGKEFTAEQIGAISDKQPKEVEQELDSLFDAGILLLREAAEPRSYQFSHALLADAVYASLLNTSKKNLHAKVADMLDRNGNLAEHDPEIAAFHYEGAERYEQALTHRELAAKRAALRSATSESAYHYAKAVSHSAFIGDSTIKSETELRLRLALGTQLIANKGNAAPEVGENYLRASELCVQVEDENLLWQTYYGLWSYHIVSGRLPASLEMSEKMISLPICLQQSYLDVVAHRAQGLSLFAMGQFMDSLKHLEYALDRHSATEDFELTLGDVSDAEVLLKCSLGWLYCYLNKSEQGIALHKQAIKRAESQNLHHSLAYALALAAASYQVLGDKLTTLRYSERLVAFSVDHDYPYWRAWGEMLVIWAKTPQPSQSQQLEFEQALKDYNLTGAQMMNAYFVTLQAEIAIELQEYTDALQKLDAAEQYGRAAGAAFYTAELHRLRAIALWELNKKELSLTELQAAHDLAKVQSNRVLQEKIEKSEAAYAASEN